MRVISHVWCSVTFGALLLAGCATPSRPTEMVAVPPGPIHSSDRSVSVTVSGGMDTSATLPSQISNEAFAQALRDSIQRSGLFAAIGSEPAPRYALSAFIGKLDQPLLGGAMTVTMEVSYSLTDTLSGKAVWTGSIESTYTAPFGEAIVGATRLRLANEGAARKNIEQTIEAISALNL